MPAPSRQQLGDQLNALGDKIDEFAVRVQSAPTPEPLPQPFDFDSGGEFSFWASPVIGALFVIIAGGVLSFFLQRSNLSWAEIRRFENEKSRDAEQDEREGNRDEARAKMDQRLEDTRAAREHAARRRLAHGAIRLLSYELKNAAGSLTFELDLADNLVSGKDDLYDDPFSKETLEVKLAEENMLAIATWVSSETWDAVLQALGELEWFVWYRGSERHDYEREHQAGGKHDWSGFASLGRFTEKTLLAARKALEAELSKFEAEADPSAFSYSAIKTS